MNKSISWRQYRDESKRSVPQKLKDMITTYKENTGRLPSVIGLPRGHEEVAELLRARFVVELVVPAWAPNEIWLGVVDGGE